MVTRGQARRTVNFLRDCDDMVHIITGKRIPELLRKGLDIYGPDIKKAAAKMMGGEAPQVPEDSPYRVLHCRPEASDLVIKARFRELVKDLHPDVSAHPDTEELKRVIEAFNQIMSQRHKEYPPEAA